MRDLAEADHWIRSLDPAPALACTVFVREPQPHVTVSLTAVDGGRAVLFDGVDALVGRLTAGEIRAISAIDRVEVLGSGVAADDATVDTGGFVRPRFRGGELVLVTMPAAGGVLVPFETRDPTPCCADHG